MIRVEPDRGGAPVVLGDLAVGSVAYLDADWISVGGFGEVPALLATSEGKLPGEATDSDVAAARAFLATAHEAARAAASRKDKQGPVEVHGRGIVSRLARAILSDQQVHAEETDSRPSAIVDATGDPARIVDMTRRLADLGMLVLVGEPLGRRLDMQLYPDVHARGLRIVGIAPSLFGKDGEPNADLDGPLLELSTSTLCHTRPKTLLPDASWYAVHFSTTPEAEPFADQ